MARPPDRGRLSDACVACQALTHASCDDVVKTCGCARSGVYGLAVGASSFEGWCELELRPGEGWLLAGRSVQGQTSCAGGFGWSSSCGSVRDDTRPYSLGVLGKLAVTQVLVGSRLTGKEWGPNVYKFVVPQPFETACSSSCALGQAEAVKGSCTPPLGWPSMFTYAGFVKTKTHFFFRDTRPLMNFGLLPGGFNLAERVADETPCQRWGELQTTQGMLFVR